MRELTNDRPKGMVEVAGKTLLQWQMAALKGAGINEIYIVRGYLGDAIPYSEPTYLENPRWESTNMVSSLLAASELLSADDCVVSYADIIYPAETVQRLMGGRGDIRITYDTQWLELWQKRFADPIDDAETFRLNANGTLAEIGQKARTVAEIEGQYMGLLYFSPQGWRRVVQTLQQLHEERVDRLDMTTMLRTVMAHTPVHAVPVDGGWFEFDGASDIDVFNEMGGYAWTR
ncbi:phosphocholine cytidylyltransferase family protein [Geomonas sp. RF6]|nr:phosphocholine cytidylyltransferase family protein [Geomonas sp. RF6]